MRRRTLILSGCWAIAAGCLPGCTITQIGVSNPAPNLPRIAIAPFVNLSPERSVDGRRFAEAYYTELQKVPGFQVIPVGVVESAMYDYGLNLDRPEDLRRLIELLDVDSICFGAITEYNPYYPPRLGLQISWYTTQYPEFRPGLPTQMEMRERPAADGEGHPGTGSRRADGPRGTGGKHPGRHGTGFPHGADCAPELPLTQSPAATRGESGLVFRGQSPGDQLRGKPQGTSSPTGSLRKLSAEEQTAWDRALRVALEMPGNGGGGANDARVERAAFDERRSAPESSSEAVPAPKLPPPAPATQPPQSARPGENPPPARVAPSTESVPPATSPQVPLAASQPQITAPAPLANAAGDLQPYMSYTRVFDGADAEFTASLKDYLELSGDERSGGWAGYMHRSEDFIRFCMHRMILEMLQLHGGESKKRIVLTARKYR